MLNRPDAFNLTDQLLGSGPEAGLVSPSLIRAAILASV